MTTSTPAPRGSSPIFRRLLPALLLASFVASVFQWNPFGRQPRYAYFEAIVRPSVDGECQFLSDIDGVGLRQERTASQPVKAGQDNHVRFRENAGNLSSFVFSPLAAKGDVDIFRCWWTTEDGEVVAVIPPTALAASFPSALRLPNGGARLPGMMDEVISGLRFDASPAIALGYTPPPPVWQILLVFVVTLLVPFALARFASPLPWRRAGAVFWRFVRVHPCWAIFLVGVVSVTISCFPVIFCGKSFVSPDNGMQLLYEKNPTVPGAQGGRVENPTMSDMGATFYWHMPVSAIQHRSIFEDGEFPFWNRYNWGGISLWSQSISMLGDPLHWPAVLTGGAAWAWDLKFLLCKVLFAFGVGLLVRSSSRSMVAALLLAASAPWIGFFAYRFCHAAFFALSYAPWVLLAWLEAARAPNLRRVALWGGVLMLANWLQLNSGTAKESSAFILCLNAAGLLALAMCDRPVRERVQRVGLFLWANILFLLLSAPLWWCFLDALGNAETGYDKPLVGQMQPGLLIGVFDDIFQRQFMRLEFLFNPSINFFILLGVAWALARGRALAREGTFRAVLIVTAGVAAVVFGVISPAVITQVPFVKSIHHIDNTFSCVLFILSFVVAGYGLRECHRRMRSPEWRGDWIIVLVVVFVLLGAFFGMTQAAHRTGRTFLPLGETMPKSEFFWMYASALVLALAVLPWAWRGVRLRREGAAWALVAIAAWATLHFRHGMYLETKFDIYTMNPKTRLDLRDVASPALRQLKAVMKEPARMSGMSWVMVPGFNIMPGFESISGADALQDPNMRGLHAALGIPQHWFWRSMVWRREFEFKQRALDMLGVRYYLENPGKGGDIPGVKVIGSSDLDLLESESAWPRAFFTDAVLAYQNPKDIALLVQNGDGRPFATMLRSEIGSVSLPPRDFNQRQVVRAHNYRLTQNTTTFEIDAPSPGLAVLGESWLPGDLQVLVDGRPANVLRVNHAFRGVVLDRAGKHTVKFSYWPKVMDKALALCAIGAAGVLASVWLLLRQRRREESATGMISAESELGKCPIPHS